MTDINVQRAILMHEKGPFHCERVPARRITDPGDVDGSLSGAKPFSGIRRRIFDIHQRISGSEHP